jgi:uncharacterized protein YegP (UPF0339 family)
MATATKKPAKTGAETPRPTRALKPAGSKFLIYEDNAGQFRWTLVDRGEHMLAESASFGTYAAAEKALAHLRESAGTTELQR